jgi:2,3-bisphosphoglycerate-dependent phosphoglycerate mutase
MSTIWFIRHTESQSNIGLPTLGPHFTGLTERGTDQAKCIARFFPQAPSLIITSNYMRTQQTAQPTRDHFPYVPYEEWPVHEFTYLSRSHSLFMSTQDRRPRVDAFWERCDPSFVDGDGAESFTQFMTRVYNVVELLYARKEDFTAIFTHGQFMRAAWWLLRDPPGRLDSDSMKYFRNLLTAHPIPNGAILPVAFLPGGEVQIGSVIETHLIEENEERPLREPLPARMNRIQQISCNGNNGIWAS